MIIRTSIQVEIWKSQVDQAVYLHWYQQAAINSGLVYLFRGVSVPYYGARK
jgi:hypothetical protein